MHEMSLAEDLLALVEQAANAQGFRRVREINLEIGALAGVETEALAFCLESVLKGSLAEGARVNFTAVPGEGWCLECAAKVPIAALYAPCPRCGGYQVQATSGFEMRVKDLLVE